MRKFIFLFAVLLLVISCVDETTDTPIPGSTMYKEILPIGRTDTALIRFVFQNEGYSKLTGKVTCSKNNISSTGDYYKFSHKPLKYYFQNTLELFSKNVVYYQIDSLTTDTFRIKITFPVVESKQDTLVYKAFKHYIP